MGKATAVLVALAVLAGTVAHGQDIAGIEDCTKTAGLDKRTGCFRSCRITITSECYQNYRHSYVNTRKTQTR